jgi:hypothetical protein
MGRECSRQGLQQQLAKKISGFSGSIAWFGSIAGESVHTKEPHQRIAYLWIRLWPLDVQVAGCQA